MVSFKAYVRALSRHFNVVAIEWQTSAGLNKLIYTMEHVPNRFVQ